MTGTLHGVGLGPGDPELMTLRAHRLIRDARVIAYPAPAGRDSFAREIAAAAIPPDAEEIAMQVPMVPDERFPAQTVYADAARRIGRHLDRGTDVVVLCEGDPFFYGSFMYLHARLAERYPVRITPGVSSLTACAAAAGRPLTARNEVLTVLPGTLPDDALAPRIRDAEAIAILKVGRHLPRLRALLERLGMAERALLVARASLAEQQVSRLCEAPVPAPYFSMILAGRGTDPWLT